MRKIGIGEILVFTALFASALTLAVVTTGLLFGKLPLGDFRGITLVVAAVLFLYLYAFAIYRLFLFLVPLDEGEIAEKSREEFGYHVYILFYLILFYPLMRGGAVPMPMMRLIYQALGARLGTNTYSAGIIHDPPFVEIGMYSTVGRVCSTGAARNRGEASLPLQDTHREQRDGRDARRDIAGRHYRGQCAWLRGQ